MCERCESFWIGHGTGIGEMSAVPRPRGSAADPGNIKLHTVRRGSWRSMLEAGSRAPGGQPFASVCNWVPRATERGSLRPASSARCCLLIRRSVEPLDQRSDRGFRVGLEQAYRLLCKGLAGTPHKAYRSADLFPLLGLLVSDKISSSAGKDLKQNSGFTARLLYHLRNVAQK